MIYLVVDEVCLNKFLNCLAFRGKNKKKYLFRK